MSIDKQDILDYAMNKVESVKKGDSSALDVYPELNELKKTIDGLRKEIYDHVIAEAEKYDKREDIIKGDYKISIVSRARYKYKQDPDYAFMKRKLKNRKGLIKEASEKREPLVDPETGETVDPVDITYSTYPKCEFVGQKL